MEDGPFHPTLRSCVVGVPRQVPQPLPVARQTQELPGSRTRQRCWIGEYTHEKKSNSLRKPILIMDALEILHLLCLTAVRAVTCAREGSSDSGTYEVPVDAGCAAALAPSIPKCLVFFSSDHLSTGFSCHSSFPRLNLCCLPVRSSDPVPACSATRALPALCTIAAHLHENSFPPELLVKFCRDIFSFQPCPVKFLPAAFFLSFRPRLLSVLKTVVFKFWDCKTLCRFVKACW